MPVPFVGPSYECATRKIDCQRSVNLFPRVVESQTGKAPVVLQPVEGLTLFGTALGGHGARGCFATDSRAFIVMGPTLYELSHDGTRTSRGDLDGGTNPVDIGANSGQLILVDGASGWVFDLKTNALTPITADAFSAGPRVAAIDGYAVLPKTGTAQFILSGIDDFTSYNALDFASAEGAPGNIVSIIASHREAWIMKQRCCEVWDDTGQADFPFARIESAFIEHGTTAPFSLQALDNTVFWLGSGVQGGGVVWRAQGYNPVRISTHAIEEAIQSIEDVSAATAYTYQKDGHSFYALNVPGLDTTLVYDVATGSWHERAELVNGQYAQSRGVCHMYAFGKHLIGGSDGNVYWLDVSNHTNNGDPLVRDRISPHYATPSYDMQPYAALQIDCNVGEGKASGLGATLLMRYSDDGGITFKNWHTCSVGNQGQTRARAIFRRLGESRDRVWHVRMSDPVPFTLVGAAIR